MPFSHLFIQYLSDDPQFFWAVCITVVVSICIHELAHGITAIAFGDSTPIETGHMTLNPVKHMGVSSLILLLVAGIAWGVMPVNPNRLRGRYARSLVALAGPASNIIMAAAALAILAGLERVSPEGFGPAQSPLYSRDFLWIFGSVNVTLAIFNLIPIPPLDGSNIVAGLSPAAANIMRNMRTSGQAGVIFLLIFMFAGKYISPLSKQISQGYFQWVSGL
jgi:Zn-dependent protease